MCCLGGTWYFLSPPAYYEPPVCVKLQKVPPRDAYFSPPRAYLLLQSTLIHHKNENCNIYQKVNQTLTTGRCKPQTSAFTVHTLCSIYTQVLLHKPYHKNYVHKAAVPGCSKINLGNFWYFVVGDVIWK